MRRLIIGLLLAAIAASPSAAEPTSFAARKAEIVQLFAHGQVRPAVEKLRAAIADAPSPQDKAVLQRDLLEFCATGSDWRCVAETANALWGAIAADPRLSWLKPEVALYVARFSLWSGNDAEIERSLRQWGPQLNIDLAAHPATAAELQIALHDYYVRKNDLPAAERGLSAAVLGLFLTDTAQSHTQAKLIVGLIGALVHARDVVGAVALAARADPFISQTVSHDSVLYARYRMLLAELYSYGSRQSLTVSAFAEAARLIERLDIDEADKTYNLTVANSLASAALLLDGKVDEARALHARHPLQKERDDILRRGEFASEQEFFFAVSDAFVNAVAQTPIDSRWKPLFEKPPRWKLDELELRDVNSYRDFALGLIELAASNADAAGRLLRRAARERIDNVDAVLRSNSEGFPLPSLVDRIVIMVGLSTAVRDGSRESLDLILRGSEVLGRNLRHALADVAALIGSQPNEAARRDAHFYIQLLRHKRDWELDRIAKLLARDASLESKTALVRAYTEMVTALNDLKERLRRDHRLAQASGLPTLAAVQSSMPAGGAYVAYFPVVGGTGKLCLTRDRTAVSTAPFAPETATHVRLLEFAMTAAHPPDAVLDAQFPVASAIYLRDVLFGGLESCLWPGMHAAVALPPEFAGVPLGVLLSEAPPRAGNGFDLAAAHWLIRQMSVSRVISARHYLATLPYLGRPPAPRPLLGLGDPRLDKAYVATLASASGAGAAILGGLADLGELPETAQELRAVAALMHAPASDVLTRERATEASLRKKPLGDYDVLHIATHGLIKQDLPGLAESALVLTPESATDRFNDGLLSASEIAQLSLHARLAVLSACNTATYDPAQASLGAEDLQAAFTVAGVPALVASLWPVESATAREIVVRFFEEWRSDPTAGAAEVLARATRGFLATADAAHRHPRFWAAFAVIGNGAVRPAGSPERAGDEHRTQP